MKIIDKKGRLFGLINIVDLMVLLAVVFAVGAIGVKLFAAPLKEATSPNVDMTTTFRIRGASEYLQAEIAKNPLEGEQLVAGNAYVPAHITTVETTDYVTQVITDTGEIINAIDPTKKDILVTVESVIPKDTPTPKIGNQEVRSGRTFTLKTKIFEMNANIESVDIHDGDN